MASTLQDLDNNIIGAFRTAWNALIKATTGTVATIAATADPLGYTRADGVSFLNDNKFDPGDQIVVSGFAHAVNNGVRFIEYVDDTTLIVRLPTGAAAMVDESAGASVKLQMDLAQDTDPTKPRILVKLMGDAIKPTPDAPWLREHYQPTLAGAISLRAPTARVRQRGLYWLTVFYPSGLGQEGAARLRGKLRAVMYPDVALTYNGQVVRVTTVTPKDPVEEDSWVGLPLTCAYYADTFNPA